MADLTLFEGREEKDDRVRWKQPLGAKAMSCI